MNPKQLIPPSVKKVIKDFIKAQVTAEARSRTTRLRKTIEQITRDEVKRQLAKPKPQQPDYGNNTVINPPIGNKCTIKFAGENNILYIESENRTLEGCSINFEGDDAVVYISDHLDKAQKYRVKLYVQSNTVVYIGENVNFHPSGDSSAYMTASEEKNIIIGDDCLFSINTWLRTSDGHAAYDITTKKRINPAGSIFIGDHVWFGQHVTVLKGSRIGSGSIIGAGSIVAGKKLASNTSFAGTPVKKIKDGIFFTSPNANPYSGEELTDAEYCNVNDWIYSYDKTAKSMGQIDTELSAIKSSAAKLAYIEKHLAHSHRKNRFYIGKENQ